MAEERRGRANPFWHVKTGKRPVPYACDWDEDGDLDLVVLGRLFAVEGHYC